MMRADEVDVVLRAMSADDHPGLMSLWKEAPGVVVGQSDTPEAIGRFLARSPGLSFVAEAEGRIVGAVLCGHDGRRGYLHHLAVAADQRRRGIGRGLVARCLERLAAEGIAKCHLLVFTDNDEAREFWLACGWTVREDLRIASKWTRAASATLG
jgi:ribosomal protein S18 acetylase RimI-like enzyme